MNQNELITIATTSFFINLPPQLNGAVSDELLNNIEQQIVAQYRSLLRTTESLPTRFDITHTQSLRGCIIIEISIGAGAIALAIPSVLAAIRDYKTFKESLREMGKDVRGAWFAVKGGEVEKAVCVMDVQLENEQAVDDAIRELRAKVGKARGRK
jgi:hypothetical protein